MISVIIPMYNAEKFIAYTLDSVLSQSYHDIEIILVDDKSSDNSVKIVDEYIKRYHSIRMVRHDVNQGIYQSRNTGVMLAQGEYVAFIDSDDLWESNKLRTQMEFMQRTGASLCYTGYDFIDYNAVNLNKTISVPLTADYRRLLKNNVIATSTVMIKTNLIQQHLMPAVKYEDYACWLDILKTGVIAHGLDQVLCHYRKHPNSSSSSKTKASTWVWSILRNREELAFPYACYCMAFYTVKGVIKHFMPFKKVRV